VAATPAQALAREEDTSVVEPGLEEQRRKPFWRELPVLIVIAFAVALLIKTFLLQAFFIPSASMEPTLVEGERDRIQVFEGIVIRRRGSQLSETFTVRKISFGVGVERTFPVHSPMIAKIEIASRGDVRRAKLYYLRSRVGKKAKVKERR